MTCPAESSKDPLSSSGKYTRPGGDNREAGGGDSSSSSSASKKPCRRASVRRRRSRGSFTDLRRIPSGGQLSREDSLSSFSSLQRGDSDTSPLRRSFSDTLVTKENAPSPSSVSHCVPRTNATFHVAQRSGAPLVRDIIASIEEKTSARNNNNNSNNNSSNNNRDVGEEDQAQRVDVRSNDNDDDEAAGEDDADNAVAETPEAELSALSNCALDPYYRVIAAASGGIVCVVRAMSTFHENEQVQASGCAALASVCSKNRSNQITVGLYKGVDAVLNAMRHFPRSVGVQSAGCDALANLTSLAPSNVEALRKAGDDFETLMERAMNGFMPPSCREGAEEVLRRTRSASGGTPS